MSLILTRSGSTTLVQGEVIKIGLLNNLSDAGLESGERQIVELLNSIDCDRVLSLSFFTLPSILRGSRARADIAARYSPLGALLRSDLDGLIVTGCEPRAETLPDEMFWRELTEVIDWAEHHTRSTIWSCLSAHAAVLHLDGIERRRLPKKCSGVFEVEAATPHRFTEGLSNHSYIPHSRWNTLDEEALATAGYQILTHGKIGADIFIKQWLSLFVFLQGHPEYDPNALKREYKRDVDRYLAGISPDYPTIPENYFDAATEAALTAFEEKARVDRRAASTLGPPWLAATPTCWPNGNGQSLFRNWLSFLGATPVNRSAAENSESIVSTNERAGR